MPEPAAETLRAGVPELVQRARDLLRGVGDGRVVLGIAGPPGAGKSTLCEALACALGDDVAVVGMDGFHLDNPVLERRGRRHAKGAIDTFDVDGYAALLRRLADRDEPVVYAPRFDRETETSIGSAVPVSRDTALIVTEGLYLLQDEPGWRQVRELLDEVWYLDLDDGERQRRLVERRLGHGDTPDHATDWVMRVDQANAERVAASRGRADLVVEVVGLAPLTPALSRGRMHAQ